MPAKGFKGTSAQYSDYLKQKVIDSVKMPLGEALRYLHWEKSLTILEISTQCGVSRPPLTNWMKALNIPQRSQSDTTRMQMAALSNEARQRRTLAFLQTARADGWSKHKNRPKGEANPLYRRIQRICKECGKVEMIIPIRRLRPFCNKDCWQKWLHKTMNQPAFRRPRWYKPRHRPQIPVALREEIFLRQTGKCFICKRERKKMQIHHVQAVSQGGEHTLRNLVLLCQRCHIAFHRGSLVLHGWQPFLA